MSWGYGPPQPASRGYPPGPPQSSSFNPPSSQRHDETDFMQYLTGLDTAALNDLMQNEDKINQFILDNDKLKKMTLDKELITASSRSIADANLSKENTFNQLKQSLKTQYEVLKRIYETYQTNQAKIASVGKEANLETLLAILQSRLAETEDEALDVERKLNSDNLQEFLKEYLQKRQSAHLRRIKVDKMKELIIEIRKNAVPTSQPVRPAPSIPQTSSNAPYPANPVSSPQYAPYGGGQAKYHASSKSAYPPQPSGQNYSSNSWGY